MMGVFNFAGTITSGWLSDRFDNRILLAWYYGLRGLSLIWLPFSNISYTLIFIFMCYNFASALALYWTIQNLISIVQLQLNKRQNAVTLLPTSA